MGSAQQQFKVGDKAVYPACGVGVIKRIETREIGEAKQDFYVLQIISSGATLMVPTNSSSSGIRGLITRKEIDTVYSILKKPGQVLQTTWNRRFREFKEKLNRGTVADIAEVLRDLNTLATDKDLSSGEKEMMRQARQMIVSEISAAAATGEDSVEKKIDRLLLH